MNMENKETKRELSGSVYFRLEPDLLALVRRKARDAERTLSQECRVLIKKALVEDIQQQQSA
jgi:hypothetical protein